jgi:enoyl-CoA hydratase/carnithine racemase
MDDAVIVSQKGAVLTLKLNRPAKKNALSAAMYQSLADALGHAATQNDVRVVILTGGEAAFTSGNDLADFLANPVREDGPPTAVQNFLNAISTFPKPLVAAVAGVAVGVGTTLLLHCDLVYLDTTAKLQLPFVNIGLVPEAASSLLLPAAIGMARASEMLLLGEPINAEQALSYGLVNAVVAPEALMPTVEAVAERLASQPASALRAAKALLRHAQSTNVATRMAQEGQLFAKHLQSEETREAITAFFEKRKPDFSRFA